MASKGTMVELKSYESTISSSASLPRSSCLKTSDESSSIRRAFPQWRKFITSTLLDGTVRKSPEVSTPVLSLHAARTAAAIMRTILRISKELQI